eukprot:CAMPEP_0170084782 /NCGR_PEP_ID=MMETSP0019_2-20121128/19868_1 /TAXON_ID=98059 /ORGANISM="Dinobryon sp., Strain UTEXLB2267" /LENGTH=599 /DNA_ID=CAMNT_0010300993 /DNA_START=34 /DNA_END=1833 /DNA_ORIENTATION=-
MIQHVILLVFSTLSVPNVYGLISSIGISRIYRSNSQSLSISRFIPKPLSAVCDVSDDEDFISKELTSKDSSFVRIVARNGDNGHTKSNNHVDDSPSSFDLDLSFFSAMFRHSAPYIAMHRGTVVVIHIAGYVLKNKDCFVAMMDDISILHLLGIKLVLVIGVRDQLDERILKSGGSPAYHNGMRVTDESMLQILKEESGTARFEVESSLARGFRGMASRSSIQVVSGNFFYSAKPLGVRDGIDFKLTGEVRRVEVDNFMKRLDSGDVVMITSLGYSSSGEVYNVPSESLAAEVAAALKASKLVYLTQGESLVDVRCEQPKPVQSLRLKQAEELLERWGVDRELYNYYEEDREEQLHNSDSVDGRSNVNNIIGGGESGEASTTGQPSAAVSAYMRLLARCVYALTGGVKRAHLVPTDRGALLKELFTRDGAGVLISRDMYEGIRAATPADLFAVMQIIRPLEQQGVLVARSEEQLLKDLSNCFVMVRDGAVLACGMLKRYSETHAEVSCLAVHPSYRRGGRGETLLAYLERRALLMGVTFVFVLSTRTMQWFEERGFNLVDPSSLPSTRDYNKSRGSKVYIKPLGTQRDVDAEELLWNIT